MDAGWAGVPEPFYIRIGTISAGTFTMSSMETAQMVTTGIAALDVPGNQNGTGTGACFTVTLDTPVSLADNTAYAFAFDSFAPFIELNGDGTTDDNYLGGTVFTVPQGSDSGAATTFTGDRVFHLDITANPVPEPSTFASMGIGVAALVCLRRRF